jgi:thymidylate synthase
MNAHPEQQYLDAMARAWREGSERRDRTGVGTRSLFGVTMRFDLADGTVPLLTTKRIFWKSAVKELIWFLSGDTNIRPLVEQGVHIWTDWPLDRYCRETGGTIDRDAFEARIVEDAAFAAE